MMQTKWLIFFLMAFMLCSVLSGFIEGAYLSQNGQPGVLSPLMNMWTTSSASSIGKVVSLSFSSTLWNTLWHMFSWDYAMYTGIYAILKIPLFCISGGLAFTFLITMLAVLGPLLSAAASVLSSIVRGLTP